MEYSTCTTWDLQDKWPNQNNHRLANRHRAASK